MANKPKQTRRGAPIKNLNAEKWPIENAITLFEQALLLSQNNKYCFIGTLAKELGTNRHQMYYLANEKFKEELKDITHQIMGNIESNCFEQAASGKIKYQVAILALKSFHSNWTEKIQTDNTNHNITIDFSD